MIRSLLLLLLSAAVVAAVLIPTDQLTDWTVGTRVGVTGGIPTTRTQFTDVSQPPYSVDTTGAAAASVTTPKIQAALNACPANQYVFLPAGTYKVTQIAMPGNVTIRGAGPDVTILRHQGGGTTILATSQNQNYAWLNGVPVTAGNTRDSTTLTLADTSAFVVGHIAQLQWSDMTDNTTLGNGTTYIVSQTDGPGFGAKARRQMVRITAKTSTTLTITPGIIHTVQTGTTLRIAAPIPVPAGANKSGVGIEDLTIDGVDSAPTFGVWLENVRDSWCKNVKSIRIANYPFYSSDAMNVEFTHCFASGGTGGTNGAGFLINSVTGAYVYNNIIDRVQPTFEVNFGTCDSVFAYNLGEGSTMNVNHGPHNSHNLYEGNIVPSVQSDGYFGSASQQVFFRNWISGTDLTGSLQAFVIGLNRWTRYNSFVGNILANPSWPYGSTPYSFGNPNIGNGSFTGFYKMSSNIFPIEWKNPATLTSGGGSSSGTMTLPSGNLHTGQFRPAIAWNNGANWARMASVVVSGSTVTFTVETGDTLPANGTALVLWSGQEGFQGQDRDVFATYDGGTTNLRANYFMATAFAGIASNEPLAPDTLPNSLYLAAKPSWFGNLTWPPFDSTAPGNLTTSARYQRIPAGYRFINGVDPPTGGPDTTPPSLVSKTIGSTGTQLTLTFSETVTIGLGGNGGWTLNMSGVGTETLTYASGSGSSTLVFNISRAISAGETGTVSYTQPGNGVEDTSGNDLVSLSNSTVNNQASGDTTAPTPNPSTFSIIPQATGPSTITMTATTATDPTGPVQYFFNETSGNAGGSDSGWQSSPTYTDTGLASGTQYSYRVQTRDAVTPTPNVTTFSSSLSAITRLAAGARPAMPFKLARSNIVTP